LHIAERILIKICGFFYNEQVPPAQGERIKNLIRRIDRKIEIKVKIIPITVRVRLKFLLLLRNLPSLTMPLLASHIESASLILLSKEKEQRLPLILSKKQRHASLR